MQKWSEAHGCGKFTLVNLFPRFYDVTGWRDHVDGTDIRKSIFAGSAGTFIGFVPLRAGILFSGALIASK